jgi:hypothetical protein
MTFSARSSAPAWKQIMAASNLPSPDAGKIRFAFRLEEIARDHTPALLVFRSGGIRPCHSTCRFDDAETVYSEEPTNPSISNRPLATFRIVALPVVWRKGETMVLNR